MTQPNPSRTLMRAVALFAAAVGAALLLIPAPAVAQPVDSSRIRDHRVNLDTDRAGAYHANDPELMIGYEAIPAADHSGRGFVGINLMGAQFPLFTTSYVYDSRSARTRISANAIFGGLGILGMLPGRCSGSPWTSLILFGLPLWLTNMTIHVPLINKSLYFDIAHRTDFYFFYSPSRIYTEAWLGLHGRIGPISAELRYTWPLSRGYRESKGPYIGVNAYVVPNPKWLW